MPRIRALARAVSVLMLLAIPSLAEDVEVQLYRLDLGVEILDVENKPVPNVRLRIVNGARTNPPTTNAQGRTSFSIPIPFGKTIRAGDLIEVEIEPSIEQKDEDEWVIISPWEGKFQLPPEDNGNLLSVRVARRKNFEVFLSATGLQVVVKGLVETMKPSLLQYAKDNNLDADQWEIFLDTLAESAGKYYDKGLASLVSRRPRPKDFLPGEREQWVQTLRRQGENFQLLQNYKAAAESLRAAACFSTSDDPELLDLLGKTLSLSDQFEEAESIFMRVLELRLKKPETGSQIARAFGHLAQVYERTGNERKDLAIHEKALIELETADKNNGDLARFVSQYVSSLREERQNDQAENFTGRLRAAGWGYLVISTPRAQEGPKQGVEPDKDSGAKAPPLL